MCDRCKLRHELIVKVANKKYKEILIERIAECCGYDENYKPPKEKQVDIPF